MVFPSELRKKRFKQARQGYASYGGTGGYGTSQAPAVLPPADIETFSDNFNRANENLTANANWTLLAGTATDLAIAGNAVRHQLVTSGGTWAACPDCGLANHWVQVKLIAGANSGFAFALYSDASNCIAFDHNGTNYRVFVVAAGVSNQRISTVASWGTGPTTKIRRLGTSLTLYHNGVLLTTYTLTAGENTALVGTRAGLKNGTANSGSSFADTFIHGFVRA